ncbi:MAG: UDP-N-acetylmuramoyl-tripeptide--D-alanyl-D-alanine ligase, partial [Erysipelotrichaceae bacterium]|nr:UDP-N-acetylmuramoyl-tripeptide--D-alanyl-D-alanine ligase [Erysipelotrichaceae bacterium]
VGDISYLMDFVRPQYGVVTSIGKQHLNTFHDLDNIIFEKMQEVELLPLDGVAFLNNDNEYIRNYRINNRCKVVRVATEGNEADYVAKDLKYSKDGSAFTVQIDGRNYKFTTSLLGRHNITNILLGIAIARELGMDIRTIQKNVSNVKQVEHRLQVKKISNFTFIDDAFNANPEGSKNALDVLAMMPGKRIIVTPGMIDLGSAQSEINQEFGRSMLEKADEVILVGEKQTEPILAGLKEVSFPMEHVRVFKTINEALAYVYQHFSSADTILLENDLPDAFNV